MTSKQIVIGILSVSFLVSAVILIFTNHIWFGFFSGFAAFALAYDGFISSTKKGE